MVGTAETSPASDNWSVPVTAAAWAPEAAVAWVTAVVWVAAPAGLTTSGGEFSTVSAHALAEFAA